ncbi:hypothetical protein TFGA2_00050 [Neisseria gonorrhoeae]|nr:hypothetical protein TFGA2_00050 [Neisseria gonorrhoeae]
MCRLLFAFQTTCINGCKSNLFFKPPATAKPAAIRSLPVGRAGERAFSKLRQPFPTTQPPKYKPCGLLPSLQPSPTGERTGRLLGLRFAARKTGCAGCFLLFRRPASTVVNPICFSNRLQPQNLPQPAPSLWGGPGEGILQVAAIFPNSLTAQIQALRLVALSPALSHRERGRVGCWG